MPHPFPTRRSSNLPKRHLCAMAHLKTQTQSQTQNPKHQARDLDVQVMFVSRTMICGMEPSARNIAENCNKPKIFCTASNGRSKKSEPTSNPITMDWIARLLRNSSEAHTSELQSLMRISYAVFCLKKNK